jgi:hypothetical protein
MKTMPVGTIYGDLQAGHGTHVAGIIYARELMEGENSIISWREKFWRVSHVWHCFLGFPSAHQGVRMGELRESGRCTKRRCRTHSWPGGSNYEE